jgi:hypothetical protein
VTMPDVVEQLPDFAGEPAAEAEPAAAAPAATGPLKRSLSKVSIPGPIGASSPAARRPRRQLSEESGQPAAEAVQLPAAEAVQLPAGSPARKAAPGTPVQLPAGSPARKAARTGVSALRDRE